MSPGVRVAVVAEYYPRAADPVLGIWAHRQALAARAAGAEVRVLVLHRPVPSRAALRARDPRALLEPLRQPLRAELDGIPVTYVPFLAPPRPRTYARWGSWAAPTLGLALRRLRRSFPYDLVHAHYAAPSADAVRRARPGTRYVASVHGGDLLSVATASPAGARAVRHGLEGARIVLANSSAMASRARALGAADARVVHLGADVPAAPPPHRAERLVTVAHMVARKRHGDVLRALWLLRDRHPGLRWIAVGDGPERPVLERLAAELGLADRVEFRGELPHAEAVRVAQSGAAFVLPSVDEAFGVAYVEAMAGGVPAIGCLHEPGPEEISRLGGGLSLVPPGDPERLAGRIEELVADERDRRRVGEAARRTVARALHVGGLRPGDRPRLRGGAGLSAPDPRPVLFVTNHAPPYRVPAFAALHAREDVVFALVGGEVRHGGGGGVTHVCETIVTRRLAQRDVFAEAASGRYRAVVAGISGRVALPAAYAGARRARVPFVLWATIWAHPRTAAHALSYLPLRHVYRHADAIATYGPHVSAYVRRKGARGPVVVAPQAVDDRFWAAPAGHPARQTPYQAVFVGRMEGEKGLAVLTSAWRASGLRAPAAALVLVGGGRFRAPSSATGAVRAVGPQPPEQVRNSYAGSDVVVAPSVPTRDFLEPWGLVVNEAFHQGRPVIATTAVGAVAGGLVRHERNGLVVPPGDVPALAAALRRLHDDPELRARLGARRARGRAAVQPRRLGRRDGPRTRRRRGGPHGNHRAGRRSAATVTRPMFRIATALACLLALLPVSVASASTRDKIIKDCSDDGVLQGSYSPSALRDARQHLPSDVAEYTDCADVLRRAETPATPAGGSGGSGGAGGGGTTTPGGGSGSGGGGGAAAAAAGNGSGPLLTAQTDADRKALQQAATAGAQPVKIDGQSVVPGAAGLSAGAPRNGMPGTVVVALVLLAFAGGALTIPGIRRGVPFVAHRLRRS